MKKVFIEIRDRLVLATAALFGENLLEMQRDIIDAQDAVIKSMEKVEASQDRLIIILTEWKDRLERLNGLYVRYVGGLEKKADLQGLLIDKLKASQTDEEPA